jgi:hypothetical protein
MFILFVQFFKTFWLLKGIFNAPLLKNLFLILIFQFQIQG